MSLFIKLQNYLKHLLPFFISISVFLACSLQLQVQVICSIMKIHIYSNTKGCSQILFNSLFILHQKNYYYMILHNLLLSIINTLLN